jgi:molybdopterin molybdotransferase
MLSIHEALALMLARFAPLEGERAALLDATDRVLAQDVFAQLDLPEFDHSAMDGYAVRHAELTNGATLPVQNEIRAGAVPESLASGHVARIFTGAPLPRGADTVVMQENTQPVAGGVLIKELPKVGSHLRVRGSEFAAGSLLLRAGSALGPAEIGLLAAQGCSDVEVHRRPRVAILPTGDELRALGAASRPFSIVDSNSYALAAALTRVGCSAQHLGIARDALDDLAPRIELGLKADLLLTLGGVSVGDYDLVSPALRAAGVALDFHKVAIKPGKPLLFGQRAGVPVVGLPGNPVSALVIFEVFVRPCLYRMQGHRELFPELLEVALAEPYKHALGRSEFLRARLRRAGSGFRAHLHPNQSSGALSSFSEQTALAILPGSRERFASGERVQALQLGLPRRIDAPYLE